MDTTTENRLLLLLYKMAASSSYPTRSMAFLPESENCWFLRFDILDWAAAACIYQVWFYVKRKNLGHVCCMLEYKGLGSEWLLLLLLLCICVLVRGA